MKGRVKWPHVVAVDAGKVLAVTGHSLRRETSLPRNAHEAGRGVAGKEQPNCRKAVRSVTSGSGHQWQQLGRRREGPPGRSNLQPRRPCRAHLEPQP